MESKDKFTKICCTCRIEKQKSEFNKDCTNPDGLRGNCKQCVNKHCKLQTQKYRNRHDEKFYEEMLNKTMYCVECKQNLSTIKFYRNKSSVTGYHTYCEECARKREIAQNLQNKKIVYNHYGAFCTNCGIEDVDVLSIDHIKNDGSLERRTIPKVRDLYLYIIKSNFPETYQILCRNCNWKKFVELNKELKNV